MRAMPCCSALTAGLRAVAFRTALRALGAGFAFFRGALRTDFRTGASVPFGAGSATGAGASADALPLAQTGAGTAHSAPARSSAAPAARRNGLPFNENSFHITAISAFPKPRSS